MGVVLLIFETLSLVDICYRLLEYMFDFGLFLYLISRTQKGLDMSMIFAYIGLVIA